MTKKQTFHHQFTLAKKTFDHLCDSIDDRAWKQQCMDTSFTTSEVMMQNASGLAFIPHVITDIRRGKGFTPPPKFIMTIIRFFFMGFPGRVLTQREIKEKYDTAHKRVMDVLDTIHQAEWDKKAKFFGREETMEDVFTSFLQSFTEDMEKIK